MALHFSPLLPGAAQVQATPDTSPIYKGAAGQSTVYLAASAVSSIYKGAKSLFREIIHFGARLLFQSRRPLGLT